MNSPFENATERFLEAVPVNHALYLVDGIIYCTKPDRPYIMIENRSKEEVEDSDICLM